jgi:hypothetical protein
MIKIDKDIPVQESMGHKGKRRSYPFRHMDVGDSFYIEAENHEVGNIRSSIMGSCRAIRFKDEKKFMTRTQYDNKGNPIGVRCWRIS